MNLQIILLFACCLAIHAEIELNDCPQAVRLANNILTAAREGLDIGFDKLVELLQPCGMFEGKGDCPVFFQILGDIVDIGVQILKPVNSLIDEKIVCADKDKAEKIQQEMRSILAHRRETAETQILRVEHHTYFDSTEDPALPTGFYLYKSPKATTVELSLPEGGPYSVQIVGHLQPLPLERVSVKLGTEEAYYFFKTQITFPQYINCVVVTVKDSGKQSSRNIHLWNTDETYPRHSFGIGFKD